MQRQKMPGLLLGVMDGGSLEQRVLRLLDGRLPWKRQWQATSAGACALVMAGIGMAAIATSVRPWVAVAQILHANGPLPKFEVVSIKPGAAPSRQDTANEVFLDGMRAQAMIREAYQIPFGTGRVVGGPAWLQKEVYSMDAKIGAAEAAKLQNMRTVKRDEQIHLMEQAMLAERFHLKVHFETREMPIFDLVVAKGGPKVTPSKKVSMGLVEIPESGHLEDLPRGMVVADQVSATYKMQIRGFSMDDLIYQTLTARPELGHRTIVNKTGLDGVYDFSLNLPGTKATEEDHANLFVSLQEDVGLKLVPGKGMVEVLVVDEVEHPVEN